MAKRIIREDHISHERWMVSYADFLTLLLAFFVVMYSVSQLNEEKFKVLSATLDKAFNIPEKSISPIQIGNPVTAVMPGVIEDAIEYPELKPGSGRVEEEESRATTSEPQLPEEFRKISQRVEEEFRDLVQRQLLSVHGNEEWLEIELKSSLLFGSGEATASAAAEPIIAQMAAIVRDSQLPIRVEGFTDNEPIANDIYPSNWELSSARAASIVKLLSDNGVSSERLAAIGYAEFQPVSGNEDEEGRAANRRVVLMISRNARLRPELSPATSLDRLIDAPIEQKPEPKAAVQESPVVAEVEAQTPKSPEPVTPEPSGVVRIQLEGGGVLFTNDPGRGGTAKQSSPDTSRPADQP